jgi:hypothetical protein
MMSGGFQHKHREPSIIIIRDDPVSSLIFSFHICGNEIFDAPPKLTRFGQRCQQACWSCWMTIRAIPIPCIAHHQVRAVGRMRRRRRRKSRCDR